MKILVLGCDGYIGNALVQRLLVQNHDVMGIDNYRRRKWVEQQMMSHSATPILSMVKKKNLFKEMGKFSYVTCDIVKESHLIEHIIMKERPDTIVNLAHIPSGPYSQISREHAEETLYNNYIGTNTILWMIKKYIPECHYVTIGTTGEYDHYSNIDIDGRDRDSEGDTWDIGADEYVSGGAPSARRIIYLQ